MSIEIDQNAEMPQEVLHSLGFRKKRNDYGHLSWFHPRFPLGDKKGEPSTRFYFHILTPAMVIDALCEIGREEMRNYISNVVQTVDLDETSEDEKEP